MDKSDDFNPLLRNVFKKNSEGDIVYFKWGKGFIVNDMELQQKLSSLEGYKYLFCSHKAPILIPIMMFSFMIAIGFYFIGNLETKPEVLIIQIGLPIYILFCLVYQSKIYHVVKKCKVVSKEEKKIILKSESL